MDDWIAMVFICATGVGVGAVVGPYDNARAELKFAAFCIGMVVITVVAFIVDMLLLH